ncbi:MAG: elongation factor [Acidimicrobiaceae bacterium]|nr:elongation factor [Acidimicrobiaceae bacterium]MDQ1378543.1 elongation factor [Acidimicrobiaceae bacterium]MDQ1401651.1 elongation factor [Acidimicrobiaceae bacterium]MDQ1412874.1 elongation factor [Acidimicrobiaceae bacterium]MDQ1419621.1 elongation factor [Acidimicrobiaceae bacterium]
MKTFPPAKIRNVALIGHGGAGKTTTTEALLFAAGVINRKGRVEDGTTTSDFDAEEIKRHISVSVALAPFEWHDHKVNILDCPGYSDFGTDTMAALRVADLAVFVVSAVEGVEVQTELMWKAAAKLGLPRMIFVNKLDRERASFSRTLDQLQQTFGAGIAPLELPIGEEASFVGVADLLSDTAITYEGGKPTTGDIPDEMEAQEHAVHESLIEGIVVGDDDLMERYLEGEVLDFKELEETLAQGVASAQVFPVLCGSAAKDIAIDRLATFICEIGPSPLDRPGVVVQAGDHETEIKPDPGGQPLAAVFKTLADPYVGKISLFKVLSGTVRPDAILTNPRTHNDEKLHGLFTLRGKEQVPINEVPAGDLAAVAKLGDVTTGDTLAPRGTPVLVPRPATVAPVLSVAIRPKSKGDEDKLMTALHRIREEDPALTVRRDDETHQTLLSGMGEAHLAIATERLSRKFGVEVETEDVIVAYRETISATAEAEGKYKKQTGGHGQFGVAFLRVEPLPRGGGFEFQDKIVGGAIPRQFIPAVQKGIEETMSHSGVFGYPVVDVKVTCFDGKFHPVDSSEMSFKMAGSIGFRDAMGKAGPILLEPVSLLEVTVPPAYQGDVMGDLNSRRGRVQGTEQGEDAESMVSALVPTSELLRYAIDLRSITGGRGRFTVAHDHYDPLPQHLYDKVRRDTATT